MIKKITALIVLIGTFVSLQGCYDDYKEDYTHTTTYFARQFPLRTLVDSDGQDMTFEIGAVLGGKYSNNNNEQVDFIVDDALLSAYPSLTKLPDSYYSISSSSMTIPSGEFLGKASVTLNKELFMNDPLAVGNNYALPLQIVDATTDFILEDKHYSIIVVRYYNQYHGWYYVKGEDTNTTDNTSVIYSENDLVNNEDMLLETTSKNELSVPYVGNPDVSGRGMTFSINAETVSISGGAGITNLSGTGTYNPNTRNFTIEYNYTDGDGDAHSVKETLIYRNTELILEEWQ
ncbi:DUF1735 domain-containing protein [Flavivirga algicola]|uniref:DUF1735 domain-containing protein n=1 Tax=Flavivirga algicola TaxID=2729136 RepID=A0ABX1RZN1_9FLAO|nr:DUF1735 domain-containing protein [Flavivirga algicola]NMH89051.1 DUF1735 domain-containing protein [Flavivirga algicola]